jgi:indole-3-glycerol phosphate synthase
VNALEPILVSTRAEVQRRRGGPLPSREGEVRDFRAALSGTGVALIAEHKRRSPSAGVIREDLTLEQVVSAYERGGAAALSVLTEGPNFEGSLEDLRAARAASALPILRKDFIVDEYQLYEALDAGADAVLLIVAALAPAELAALHARAIALGLDALVEVHDAQELGTAISCGARLIGVNNRDLRDFSVDVQRTSRLVAGAPRGVTLVSESGIASGEQLSALAGEGVHAVLIGESLMRAEDPEAALRSLLSAAGAPAARSAKI